MPNEDALAQHMIAKHTGAFTDIKPDWHGSSIMAAADGIHETTNVGTVPTLVSINRGSAGTAIGSEDASGDAQAVGGAMGGAMGRAATSDAASDTHCDAVAVAVVGTVTGTVTVAGMGTVAGTGTVAVTDTGAGAGVDAGPGAVVGAGAGAVVGVGVSTGVGAGAEAAASSRSDPSWACVVCGEIFPSAAALEAHTSRLKPIEKPRKVRLF